jgi:hypothetical protein
MAVVRRASAHTACVANDGVPMTGQACVVPAGLQGHTAGFVNNVYVDCPNKPCTSCAV